MRYYTNINFASAGGFLYKTPKEKRAFADLINMENKNVFLIIDSWEYTQPDWVFPLKEDGINYLEQAGLRLVKIIHRPWHMSREIPVIWIF
jgi:hypothetical protein